MRLIFQQIWQILSQRFGPNPGGCPKYLLRTAGSLKPGLRASRYGRVKLAGLHNSTLAVYLHQLIDSSGGLEIVEKNNRRAWHQSGFFPEVFFYQNIASKRPQWARVPLCLGSESGFFSYRLLLEKKPGGRVDPDRDFEAVCRALELLGLEAPAWAELAGEAPLPPYFELKPWQRFRGDYPRFLQCIGQSGVISDALAKAFESNLDQMAAMCAAMKPILTHLDLMPGNILLNEGEVFFLDWEKYCYAPAGFSLGNWLYTAFRKKPPQDIGHYMARWISWISARHFGQNRDDRLTAGLFCYLCFVLEYLARQIEKKPSGSTTGGLKLMADIFFRQFSVMGTPGLNIPESLIPSLQTARRLF